MKTFTNMLHETGHRMDGIQNRMFWEAAQIDGVVISEGVFFLGGPLCLVATVNGNQKASIIKDRYNPTMAAAGRTS